MPPPVCLSPGPAVAAPVDRSEGGKLLSCSSCFFVLSAKDSCLCLQAMLEMFRLRRAVRAPKRVAGLACACRFRLSASYISGEEIESDVAVEIAAGEAAGLKQCRRGACILGFCLRPDPGDGDRARGSGVLFRPGSSRVL